MQSVPRLYETFHPEHYELDINLEREARAFNGSVKIRGAVAHNTSTITLHSKDLTVTSATANGQRAEIEHGENDALHLLMHDELRAEQEIEVKIDFSGTITDAMHGLYPCYFEVDGQKKELLATQFESHHAREVFPCIDEPEAKASFDVTLRTENGVSVLGNMPIKNQSEQDDRLVTSFETTPKMSSYLLAFVVGELQSKSATTKDGVTVTTWATHAQPAASLDFGLDVGKRSIEFFNDYFGVPYPLPKADLVALPDFGSGAMENWGLMTYREVCLLADETSSISSREYIATVIAHEVSHQWFGNLVTMKWWDNLWLNESFATLMEYVCVDALFPKWNIWMTFSTQEVLSALRRDHLPGVQAVKTTVNHPDEISTLFDPSIVYAKGARTLAMCRAFVGEEAFQRGLSQYFEANKYNNTTGGDLWESLSEASGKDVASFMTPWLEQPGMPRVHVSKTNGTVELAQSPFVIPAPEQHSDVTWPILLLPNTDNIPAIMTEKATSTASSENFTYLNCGATTHAVFDYDTTLFNSIIKQLPGIKDIDRLNFLHDATLLARAGDKSATDLVDLVEAYDGETSEPVWDIMSLAIADLKRLTEDNEDSETGLKSWVGKIAMPSYQRLGWEQISGEPESDTKLRATIIGLLSYSENSEVLDKSKVAYNSTDKLDNLDPEIRAIIFGNIAKFGSPDEIERLIKVHDTTANSDLKNDIAAGLTSTRDPQLISRLVSRLKDDKLVRRQDLFRWFAWLMRSRYSRQATWNWMTENWQWIEETFGGDKSYDDFARYSANGLTTSEWLETYRDYFTPKRDIPALRRAIDLGLADIQVRANWHERDARALAERLTNAQ